MTGHLPYQLSAMFASLVGTAGFVLALQAWTKFRGTPFGRVLGLLPVFMVTLAVYHPILVLFPGYTEIALLLEAAGFALLLMFVGLSLRVHRRMSSRGS